jgi:hypothetical protein
MPDTSKRRRRHSQTLPTRHPKDPTTDMRSAPSAVFQTKSSNVSIALSHKPLAKRDASQVYTRRPFNPAHISYNKTVGLGPPFLAEPWQLPERIQGKTSTKGVATACHPYKIVSRVPLPQMFHVKHRVVARSAWVC